MTLADASALVALVDKNQPHNSRCRAAFENASLPMVTTWATFAEAVYLLYRIGGWALQNILWDYVEGGSLTFYNLEESDCSRVRYLMERYRDTPMDLADATLVAAAEALGETTVFTLDSDFYVYRRYHREPFHVIP